MGVNSENNLFNICPESYNVRVTHLEGQIYKQIFILIINIAHIKPKVLTVSLAAIQIALKYGSPHRR